ncbi:MAG: MobC family plasmid mobilization relaxosome protein [Clostridiales bacterium]|nr:MAG: MobC family plasmid mobilization relaxosome protein [Clostridiales bacterium]
MTEYIIKCAMQKKINVIDVKPLITEVKRIGSNINRLTLLANMGKINSVYLQDVSAELQNIYAELQKNLQEVFVNGNRGCTEQ